MLFAEVPQARCVFVLYLRKFRKQNTLLHSIYGNSANNMHFCIIFAEVPQVECTFEQYLRQFRKQDAFLCNICGSSESGMRFPIRSFWGIFMLLELLAK